MQLFVTEPESTPLSQDYPIQIECATITVDLATGDVTLPGGFVCSLGELMHAVNKARQARFQFLSIAYSR